ETSMLFTVVHAAAAWALNTRRRWAALSFFFFSSRRRHTRLVSDWSSDVCSSDLRLGSSACGIEPSAPGRRSATIRVPAGEPSLRSEERRVGEEWRSRGAADNLKKKIEGRGCGGRGGSGGAELRE